MTVSPEHPAVRAAARWWADQLRTRRASTVGDETMDLMMMVADGQNPSVSPEDADRFESALAHEIAAFLSGSRWEEWPEVVDVDYWPDPTLGRALGAIGRAGGLNVLPVKTVMWVGPKKVEVRRGYRQPEVVVWSSDV